MKWVSYSEPVFSIKKWKSYCGYFKNVSDASHKAYNIKHFQTIADIIIILIMISDIVLQFCLIQPQFAHLSESELI